MTDIPTEFDDHLHAVPSRLGTDARVIDGELVIDLEPDPQLLHHGVLRASVLAMVVDILAGVPLDVGVPDWTLTSDLSVRTRAVPAPTKVRGTNRLLRKGRRTGTYAVDLHTADDDLLGTGAAGFTIVTRKPDDPPKVGVTFEQLTEQMTGENRLDVPVREAAEIRVLDAEAGIVEIPITPMVQNPAGTLQGAMVALVAESAAEDMVATRTGRDVVVTSLDLRYLARTGEGPIRTRSRMIGDGPDATVEVELVDTSTETLTTFVYAGTAPVD